MPSEETKVRYPTQFLVQSPEKIPQERVIRAIDFGRVCSFHFHARACRLTPHRPRSTTVGFRSSFMLAIREAIPNHL
jgi:hypothetical protein